tara:strand:+ start:2249 stop:4630 length:2382 start_codon:yes stop_codon:yes gene_type:complete
MSKFQLRVCLCLLLQLFSLPLLAQQSIPQLTRIDESVANIDLDGFIDELVWENIPVVDGMKVINPDTLEDAPYETHVRMFYTERGIYLSAMNYQPPDTLVARMTSRDTKLDRDGFVFGIDASGDGLYGYFLRINLGDSMTDASLLPERQMNMQWDGSWNGRTQALDDGWSVEYFVPWSMMPLPQVDGVRQIGIYFERQLGHLGGEAWSNPALPRTVNQYLSAFEKYELRDIEPRRQLTYYPFASAVIDNIAQESEFKVGSEIFWRPTTNTLLSATLNPDFGNVESDDVVVNLTAFEVFFPEKRSFFLEGQDIFNTSPRTSDGGPSGPISLLNTRRIGGAASFDVPENVNVLATDLSRPTELLGAVKLAGQNGNWRYGALLASEDDTEIRGVLDDGTRVNLQAEGREFTIARVLYEETNSGGRRALGWMGTDVSHSDINATVNSIDAHYFSADNRWVLDGQLMHSDVQGVTGAGGFADVSFRPERGVQHTLRSTYIDDTLEINDLGFLKRNDQMNLDYTYTETKSDIPELRERKTSLRFINRWNTAGHPVRMGLFFDRDYTFLNNNRFDYSLRYFPERTDDRLGDGTGDFRILERWAAKFGYSTNRAESISYNVGLEWDAEEIGPALIAGSAGIVWRPDDRFSTDISLEYTDREALLVHQGDGNYTSFEAHQWSPKLEMNYFISAKQQLRFTAQWIALKGYEDRFWQVNPNSLDFLEPVENPDTTPDDFVISRLTFQARYRWEIAPLSDLFLVYTRGSNLPSNSFETFQDLLERSWNDRIVDTIAIKLRYRLGS